MSAKQIRRFEYESDTWKRQLSFIREENIYLKKRLIEILKEKLSPADLEAAESFQTLFIEQDKLVTILGNSVAEFDRLLKRELFEDGALLRTVMLEHLHIDRKISEAEASFDSLKRRFNNYMWEEI